MKSWEMSTYLATRYPCVMFERKLSLSLLQSFINFLHRALRGVHVVGESSAIYQAS